MFAIIGIVVVFGCVVAGYLMEHGNLRVLIQPAELVTIGGAVTWAAPAFQPPPILYAQAGGRGGRFRASLNNQQTYHFSLAMMAHLAPQTHHVPKLAVV